MGLDTKTYWLTDRQSQCDFDFHKSKSKADADRDRVSKKEEENSLSKKWSDTEPEDRSLNYVL
jgi:hypothetical protein